MAERRPLVYANGGVTELPVADTIVGGGGGGVMFALPFTFTGDGVEDEFDLEEEIGDGMVLWSEAGVPQLQGTHFTVSGSVVTRSDAPADGVSIIGWLVKDLAPDVSLVRSNDVHRIVKLTQTEYDALDPADADTLYIIVAA